jgi:hypothetical protein
MNARDVIVAFLIVVALAVGLPTSAAEQCVRDAFLTIGGPAAATGAGQAPVHLTEAQLLALPISTITTSTEWTPLSRFDGPLLSDVLKLAPVQGKMLHIFALDDYSISIPWSDMAQYGVILAHTQDGQRMSRRRFGPLFVIYPRDRFASLQTPTTVAKFIWQVCRIDVE